MSGGRFNYYDSTLKNEIFGWGDNWRNVFEDREISELVWDVLELIHIFDYYESGDSSREKYTNAKAEFKKKWLSNRGVRVKHTIDTAIDDLRQELYETYGMESEQE